MTCTLSDTSLKARHTLSSQPYRGKVPCVQRGLWSGDFGSHRMLKIKSSNFPMIVIDVTQSQRCFRQFYQTHLQCDK